MPRPAPTRSILPLLGVAIALLALLSPLFVHHAKTVEIDASMEVFFSADERSKGSFEQLEELMTENVACLVLAKFDGIFSDEGAALVAEIGESLYAIEGVERVFSLTRARRPVRAMGLQLNPLKMIEFEYFLPHEGRTEEEWREIETRVTDYPWARDLLVSRDGGWTMLIAEVARALPDHEARAVLRDEVSAALDPFRDRVDELHFGGFPFIEAEVRDAVESDVTRFFLALPIVLAVIILATFRSVQVLLTILVFEALGVAFLPVLVNWNGTTINLYTGILFPLVAGLQLTFLTHFLASLLRRRERGATFVDALDGALRHVLKPSAIAAFTTAVGLLSLYACDVALVRTFGNLGAQAVVATFLVTFGPSLLLARYLRRRGGAHADPEHADAGAPSARGLVATLARVDRRRAFWIAAAGVLVLGALPAQALLRTDLRAIEFLSESSDARRAMTALDRHMGGMNLFELEVDFGEGGSIQTVESLRYLEDLERYAVALDGVTNVYGYAQVYATIHELWKREAPGTRHVPDTEEEVEAMGVIVHGQEFVFKDALYDDARRRTTLFVRTQDMPAETYLDLLGRFVDYARETAPAGATITDRSGLHSVLDSDRRIVDSQLKSLALCGVVVFLTLCALWRSVRLAAAAVLVNLPPLAAVLALHGYGGVPLNSVTVMVGAVVLGIAVDGSIHVLAFWNDERADAPGLRTLWHVVQRKAGAILCTTGVLVGGLALFLLSSFPPVADFGELAIVALSVALLATLFLLPPLTAALFRLPEESAAADG